MLRAAPKGVSIKGTNREHKIEKAVESIGEGGTNGEQSGSPDE